MQTIQQQRARYALERIGKVGAQGDAIKARASELPAMIQMNGLGQAAAFYRMKGEKHGHRPLYDILSAWLCRDANQLNYAPEPGIYGSHGDLIDGITQSNQQDYRLAQAEALALMEWVKRFAKAFITDGSATSADNGED